MYRAGGERWRCAVKQREQAHSRYANDEEYRKNKNEANMNRYYNLSGSEYNRILLQKRRRKGLARMAKREARGKELLSG